ncbi:MAG TPA: tRNA (adenosine(37)-N6)-threonylcarbamoyltransferase complex transferase subunit TsaD [Thermoanaerobaculia bacterium]|nr:tRNA (adenosine(37)-N6)-threonylcarbamoyltransferase complex transferase subunit TsaD [Thermoanaerobaculia bacterium]
MTPARGRARTPPLVLGIESSCDETSVALLDGDGRILSSLVASQFGAHELYGGVVPEIAARAHLANLPPLLTRALSEAGAGLSDVGLVAATAGPGLVGALLVGLSEGKGLALGLGVPFLAAHHIEAHGLSPFLDDTGGPARPVPESFAALVVSGGHTHVFRFGERIERLARTRDDAAGEAYDKVAKMAGLGYPGGPIVDRLARSGRAARPFSLPQFKDGSSDFSFSGLKTGVRDRLAALGLAPDAHRPDAAKTLSEEDAPRELRDLLADFQEAVVAQLEDRLTRLHEAIPIPLLTVSGGVAANSLLRERLVAWGERSGIPVLLAPRALTGDNAAMIAFAGLHRFTAGRLGEGFEAPARSRWPLESLA